MVWVVSLPVFPAILAVLFFAFRFVAPVLLWVIEVVFFCHIMCWLLLVKSIYLVPLSIIVVIRRYSHFRFITLLLSMTYTSIAFMSFCACFRPSGVME